MFIVNLHSNDDLTREDAVFAFKMIPQRIANASVLEKLANHVCGVFNGSSGKLTVVAHKISVLQVNFCTVILNKVGGN